MADRAQHAIAQLDKELSKYPVLNNLERQTSVPKVYVILGLVGVYTFLVFFNIAGEFLVNLAGFIIPGYYSLNALFTAGKADDTQTLIEYADSFVIPVVVDVRPRSLDGSPPDQVSFLVMIFFYEHDYEHGLTQLSSGAQVVFHSFIQPVFGRFFAGGNTSANLRAQADAATKAQ
ncbi:ER membrane protein DP1/Yop1 [Aspergillus pseudonomiae]